MLDFGSLRKKSNMVNNTYPSIKVALLGDTSTQLLGVGIKGEGIARRYNIDLFEADYNQVERQVLDLESDLYKFAAKYVIVFQSTHKLLCKYNSMEESDQEGLAEERLSFISDICRTINGTVIVFNYPEIDDSVLGSYANKVSSSFIYQIRKLNYELMNLSRSFSNLYICDISGIQNKLGRDCLFDPALYTNTEMILSVKSIPYIASRVLDIICSIEGNIKKCLILDLDNTLWGGVVGDDGWENIQIGHGLGIGKAFSEFQEWIRKLKNRGVIICVCSKNDEDKAKEPFLKNPEMKLKLDDFGVFIANWENKADNIRLIQSILNIGFDTMVFIDDNPFERNMVREEIPNITVPEMPEDPADYLEFLYGENLFETASISREDRIRTKQYQIESLRINSSKQFTKEDDFLKSLNMISEVCGFNSYNIPRIAQLSQRSNQFNLRTIRYTDNDIKSIGNNPFCKGFAFTLKDKFGDNGLIAVVILVNSSGEKYPDCINKDDNSLFIDTWFMSCRVLKRGMENFTLNTIVNWAKNNGYRYLYGEYIPTEKNEMVRDHYNKLGFHKCDVVDKEIWMLDIVEYTDRECNILRKKEGEENGKEGNS